MKVTKRAVWDWFSLYIRLKYADESGVLECFTCGAKKYIKDMQAGHALTGRRNAVLFDEEIVRPQCERCNIWLAGNLPRFTGKLIKENGLEWWEGKMRDHTKVVHFSQQDIEHLYKHYREACNEMLLKVKNPNALPKRWKEYLERLKKKGGTNGRNNRSKIQGRRERKNDNNRVQQ